MNRPATIVRGTGLMIEAEAVVSMMRGTNHVPEEKYPESMEVRMIWFFLETNSSVCWIGESEEEANRVFEEVIRAKLGDAPPVLWGVSIDFTFFPTDVAAGTKPKWETERISQSVAARTREEAIQIVQDSLPGNTQDKKYKIVDAKVIA